MKFSWQRHSREDDNGKNDDHFLHFHTETFANTLSCPNITQRPKGGSSGLVQRTPISTANSHNQQYHRLGNLSAKVKSSGTLKQNGEVGSSRTGISNNNAYSYSFYGKMFCKSLPIFVTALLIILLEWKVYQWSRIQAQSLIDNHYYSQNIYQEETHHIQPMDHDNFNSIGNTHPTVATATTPMKSTLPSLSKVDQSSSPYLYNANLHSSLDSILSEFPMWIQNYIRWHREQRLKFPGKRLFEDPEAPPILVRTCLGKCGGLHDRIGQLPWDIYLANVTGRVLLLSWQRPPAIEEFLIPNHIYVDQNKTFDTKNQLSSTPLMPEIILDWRVPPEIYSGFDSMKFVRDNWTSLFQGMPENRPSNDFWSFDIDCAIQRATGSFTNCSDPTIASFQSTKVLHHRILGHLGEQALEKRLVTKHGESIQSAQGLHTTEIFGNLFWLFFRPNPSVEQWFQEVIQPFLVNKSDAGNQDDAIQIASTNHHHHHQEQQQERRKQHNSELQSFTAVHCRVRHPKGTKMQLLGKNPEHPADKSGLLWEGDTRQFAIDQARQALQCAANITSGRSVASISESTNAALPGTSRSTTSTVPIYFLSDSNDLVRHVAFELTDPDFVKAHQGNTSVINSALSQMFIKSKEREEHYKANGPFTTPSSLIEIFGRNVSEETAHLDRQVGLPASAYWSTFVDLLLVAHAECVVYGIGYYGSFGAKIGKSSYTSSTHGPGGSSISKKKCQYFYQQEVWGTTSSKLGTACPTSQA